MGAIRTKLLLAYPKRADLAPIEVDAGVDLKSIHLRVPPWVARRLDLEELEQRTLVVADGSERRVPYAGPIVTAIGRRRGHTGAMVVGDEVRLGSIPVDDMDLVVSPSTREVVPNPLNPNIPASIAMGVRPVPGD